MLSSWATKRWVTAGDMSALPPRIPQILISLPSRYARSFLISKRLVGADDWACAAGNQSASARQAAWTMLRMDHPRRFVLLDSGDDGDTDLSDSLRNGR